MMAANCRPGTKSAVYDALFGAVDTGIRESAQRINASSLRSPVMSEKE